MASMAATAPPYPFGSGRLVVTDDPAMLRS
jgi:hypothetical protein